VVNIVAMEKLGLSPNTRCALAALALFFGSAAASAQSSSEVVVRRADENASVPAPPRSPVQAPLASGVSAAADDSATPPGPEVPRARLPAFIALGIGGVAAGAALVTGIIANSDYDDAKSSCSPTCSDAQLSSGRTFALTSTIFTGLALVGVGTGVTLLLTSGSPDPEQTSFVPRVTLAGAPGAAHAGASWRF